MPELPAPAELVGKETPPRDLVIDRRQVEEFLEAIDEVNPPFAASTPRFGNPILPPTIWSLIRPGGDPEVAVPRYGTGLNAGNAYRWLAPVRADEPLIRQTRIA